MTDREIALERLAVCAARRDTAVAHVDAEAALCALLISLGYQDVVNAYALVEKRCA